MRTLSRKSFAIGLLVALLVTYTGRAVPASALAVGPLADPVYDTEIFAFKDYVEQNLSEPQLDIMFFLIGGLAVAQMGAQDAMLISPYPNEESVKEWIINCGIQLYNAVIGLVPEGDYYMGIPSIGSAGTKGVPRQVIKGLVAQMMGDAVVAINYPDLDTFLEENPNELLLPFNPELQLGVNAVFGLNGGVNNWQITEQAWDSNFTWYEPNTEWSSYLQYEIYRNELPSPRYLLNRARSSDSYVGAIIGYDLPKYDIFINISNNKISFHGTENISNIPITFQYSSSYAFNGTCTMNFATQDIPSGFSSYKAVVEYFLNLNNPYTQNCLTWFKDTGNRLFTMKNSLIVNKVYVGSSWETRELLDNITDLNFQTNNINYYQQLENDYLFDLRGFMGDLVNYVYTNKIWDNIYDFDGTQIIPALVKISTQIEDITNLIAPPVPVNLNDIAELTDNTYLERVKEHARNAGDIFANYVAFWHNCDSDLVYTMFGAAILVLVGAFVGKWGHS